MRSIWVGTVAVVLALAGCTSEGDLEDEDEGTLEQEEEHAGTPAATPRATPASGGTVPGTPTPSAPAATPTPTTATPTASPSTPAAIPRVTHGPAGDIDLDGIPDATETALADDCAIAGRTCAALGIEPPTVGTRDLVFAQIGRSGTEQDWRLPASVWASALDELAEHGIRGQVADLGLRDDIDVEATWDDPANAKRYWHLWVIYNDPATAIPTDTSGSQTYNLITIAERESDLEMRATILHEAYHALLGDLRGARSDCANEEIGGPSHSDDPDSVLYTSPDCETNEGSVYRISDAEATELAEEPFDVYRVMNADDWFAPADA